MLKTFRYRWLLAVCLLLTVAQAQVLPLNPKVRTGKLPNGMTYYVMQNKEPEKRAELRLALKAGSVLETEEERGLAHFVEHMCFNGSTNFKKNELVDYLEGIGTKFGPDLNAYTSFDETVYMLRIPTDSADIMSKGLLVMEDWAQRVTMADEEIDKERGVIIEEMRLGQGAQMRTLMKWLPLIYKGSRYAERLPIGLKEVLEGFKYETLRGFYKRWYRPDLMAIIAVGDFDVDQMEAQIKQRFGALNKIDGPQPEKFTVPDFNEPRVAVITDPEQRMTLVQLMYLHPEYNIITQEEYRMSVVRGLYNSMINQRLQELQQSEDPPFLFGYSGVSEFLGPKSAYINVAATKNEGVLRGLENIVRENERVLRHGFTTTELERQKLEMMSTMEKSYNGRETTDSDDLVGELVQHFLKGTTAPGIEYEFELYKKLLPGISLAEINAYAKTLVTDNNMALVVTAPEKEGLTLPTEADLMAVLKKVKAEDIKPYEDKVSNQPLMAQEPKAVKAAKTSEYKAKGITELTFKNGAKVLLKPTKFKEDQILISAYEQGGASTAAEANYVNTLYAANLVDEMGLGTFDKIALQKALAGKQVSMSPYVGTYYHGLSGSATPKDLETALQLLHLYFTAPRKDAKAFKAWQQNEKGGLENKANDPTSVYYDRMKVVMYNNHPRRQPASIATIDKVNADAALAEYKRLFDGAAGFTFVVTGNFEVAKIKPLLEKYIGSLPAGTTGKWKDEGVRLAPGNVKEEVKKGIEPKSTVTLIFHGKADFNPQNNFTLDALTEVLNITLRENLREDRGGVYGVGCYGSLAPEPEGMYQVVISFGCNPERVDELIQAAMDEVNKIKASGAQDKELQKVKETYRREQELNLQENGYWLSRISTFTKYGWDLNTLGDQLLPMVEALSSQQLQTAAKQYFNETQYMRIVLMPEK